MPIRGLMKEEVYFWTRCSRGSTTHGARQKKALRGWRISLAGWGDTDYSFATMRTKKRSPQNAMATIDRISIPYTFGFKLTHDTDKQRRPSMVGI